ncbi:hypothetical protein CCO03_16765 [Comamonas serinivorans]|uniref:IPTL-CTERM protein sorting domain-containing protein n=1 Tax=Comamonas serinivorans TaxID=1082851 RepID=A0A1Y0ERT4_9BURK|nr:hypothetical protein CCO03_16765 [Comamonas serinivorans]
MVALWAGQAMADVVLTAHLAPPTQPWYVNDTHDFAITVTNSGTDPSPAGASVYIAVPLETELVTPLPHGCVARPSALVQYVDCPVPVTAAGASTTLTLPATGLLVYEPPGNGMDLRVITQFSYDNGSGAVQQFPATYIGGPFYIVARPTQPVGTVAPVPTLGGWALGLLGASLAALGLRRKRQAA